MVEKTINNYFFRIMVTSKFQFHHLLSITPLTHLQNLDHGNDLVLSEKFDN